MTAIAIHHLLDLQYVKRWNIVGTTMEDNVQSHSFRVAVIAMAICRKMPIADMSDFINDVVQYALLHDAEEAFTGDIATPVKDEMKKSGFNPTDVFRRLIPATTKNVNDVVKMADLIDNYYFIKTHGVGERAREAERYVSERMRLKIRECSDDLAKAANEVLYEISMRCSCGKNEERIEAPQYCEEAIRRE